MCELGMMLGIASSVAGFAADSAKTAEENKARSANRTAAIVDFNAQQTNEQHNLSQETKTTNEEGFDTVLAARAARSKAHAEASTMGAAGVSVDAVMNELTGQQGRNLTRIKDKHQANVYDYGNRMTTASSQVQSRFNANQPLAGPSPLGLAINIAGAFA